MMHENKYRTKKSAGKSRMKGYTTTGVFFRAAFLSEQEWPEYLLSGIWKNTKRYERIRKDKREEGGTENGPD